jgi:hypothetical protein
MTDHVMFRVLKKNYLIFQFDKNIFIFILEQPRSCQSPIYPLINLQLDPQTKTFFNPASRLFNIFLN